MKSKGARKDEPAGEQPLGAGHGSFDRVDSAGLFRDIKISEGSAFLDVCCGRGDYLVAAAPLVGPEGRLYAVDLWKEGIAALEAEARRRGIRNLRARVADVGRRIPFGDAAADSALMAVVLHDLVEEGKEEKALRETARVVRPGGLFAVLEFKKIEAETGPPKRVRLEPRQVAALVSPHGFSKVKFRDLGPDLYLIIFRREAVGKR